MTILDLAREAGVSKTAVSFAFNAPERLAAATLKRILEKADELGYVPNPFARSLARKSSGTLGVLVPQNLAEAFRNPHFQELLQGIGAFCEDHRLSLTLIPPQEGCLITAVRNAAVDGVITLGFTPSGPFLELLRHRALPLVTIDSRVDGSIPSVTFEDRRAAKELMTRVLARGFRRIHVVRFPPAKKEIRGNAGSRPASRRLSGFREALEALPSGTTTVTYGTSRVDRSASRLSLAEQPWPGGLPEVIVCLSDTQALGIYDFAKAMGLSIPRDLSVTGFDGSRPLLDYVNPSLYTVRQPGILKGKLAAELLEAQWKTPGSIRHLVVRASYLEGDSLGYPARRLGG